MAQNINATAALQSTPVNHNFYKGTLPNKKREEQYKIVLPVLGGGDRTHVEPFIGGFKAFDFNFN